MKTFEDLSTDESVWPHRSGDHISIGPECFAMQDGSVLCWRGENYTPQRIPPWKRGVFFWRKYESSSPVAVR